jgi:hypothetical protein
MKENVLKSKSYSFAIRVVKLSQYLQQVKKEFVLSKQVLRSGTSIGALIREAEYGKVKLILHINSVLLLKKQMKLNIGFVS